MAHVGHPLQLPIDCFMAVTWCEARAGGVTQHPREMGVEMPAPLTACLVE